MGQNQNMINGNLAITGRTRLLTILADPCDQVKAPHMMNVGLAERGLAADAVMVAMHVKPPVLGTVVAGLRALPNFRGSIITMPHKEAIVPFLDDATAEVKQVGACNVIRREPDGRLVGTMLDGEGFIGGLKNIGQDVKGKRVFLTGAGGAAAGIVFAIAKYGAKSLTLHNRTMSKAETFAAKLRQAFPGFAVDCSEAKGTYDLVVNTTSLGMKDGDPLPIPMTAVTKDTVVADIVLQPEITPLVAAARERGCTTYSGKGMLGAQIGLMIDFMLANGTA
jgi:shikimate dehydrogenase